MLARMRCAVWAALWAAALFGLAAVTGCHCCH
jgi:hypothetical protein